MAGLPLNLWLAVPGQADRPVRPFGVADVHSSMMSDPDWQTLDDSLRGWFGRRLSCPADVDDLVQDTLVRIHRALPELRDDDRIFAWAHRIAQHALIDHFRRRARKLEEDLAEDLPGSAEDGDNHNALVASWLRPMMAGLPEDYRHALELTELHGMSQRELAETLGLSPSGARTRVQRGRKLLREALERCCALERDNRGNVIGWACRDPSCP